MKEYITKDRAKQFVCGHCNEVCGEEPCESSDCDWMAFIDKEPAADVAEVRHGQWIRKEDDSCYWYECSECSEKLAKTQWGNDYFSAYCPNCGAKMDKEAKEE